ncbi:hypothetical protein NA57DRAFT_58980 [Rhizodiscina lignyota]|uniref:Uncharacterized protein n=1 Tax=Rhizodiscina lignyota TaxID=1504668 RepID=A0A9P4IBL6_9PEZI|nr:hypothetical protein NA57DRAFT_58980 [Rhizodiscina lignyota]
MPVRFADDENQAATAKLELRLLHHFTSMVSFTFPSSKQGIILDLWQIHAIRLGFEFEFLLNAIYAISALHIIRDLPHSPRFYTQDEDSITMGRLLGLQKPSLGGVDPKQAHRYYLTLAVSQHREATAKLCAENSNALLLSSVLLSYQALRLLPEEHEEQANEYTPPMHWLRMTNGITQLSEASIPLLNGQHESAAQLLAIAGGEPNYRDRAALFNPANSEPFLALIDWERFPEADLDDQSKVSYERTLHYISGIHRAVTVDRESPRTTFRRLISFGPLIPSHFITLVEQRRPRALVTLALFCAMIKAVDDHWVYYGLAEREVYGIQSLTSGGAVGNGMAIVTTATRPQGTLINGRSVPCQSKKQKSQFI